MAQKGRPSSKTKSNETKKAEEITENVIQEVSKVEENTMSEKQPIIKKERSLNEMVCVKNNTHGKLVYVSKRFAGQEYTWSGFGDENYLELQELISMRNSYLTYFKECWVMLADEDLEYLNVKKYYENTINMENFDDLFKLSPNALKSKLEQLPKSMKDSVSKRAKQLKQSGELDSLKVIKTIEEVLKVDLTI
jgi:hypothetical protein